MYISPRIQRRFKIILIVIAAWFLAHSLYVTWDGLTNFQGNADVMIVLGNEVYSDSSVSPVLSARLDQTIKLYAAGRARKIFASGGPGNHGVAEGDAMKRYLELHGVNSKDIITDNNGINTYCTAVDFLKSRDAFHYSSAIIVTSFYHITRTKFILRRLGFENVFGVSSHKFFFHDCFGIVREFFAFYKYFLVYTSKNPSR